MRLNGGFPKRSFFVELQKWALAWSSLWLLDGDDVFRAQYEKTLLSFSLATISSFDAAPFCRWLDATCSPWPLLPLFLGCSDNDSSGSLLCIFSAFFNEGLYLFLAFILLSFFSQVGLRHWYPALFQKRRLRFLSDDVCVFWVCPSCLSINSSVGKDPKLPCIQIWWGWCLLFSRAFPNTFYFCLPLQCAWKVHWIIEPVIALMNFWEKWELQNSSGRHLVSKFCKVRWKLDEFTLYIHYTSYVI